VTTCLVGKPLQAAQQSVGLRRERRTVNSLKEHLTIDPDNAIGITHEGNLLHEPTERTLGKVLPGYKQLPLTVSIGVENFGCHVVLLAAPWSAVGKALRTAGPLAGKVVLDATNPHEPMVGASGAEEVALRAPGGAGGQGVQHGGRAGGRPGRRRAGAAEPAVLR
jgi:hypothetical protein